MDREKRKGEQERQRQKQCQTEMKGERVDGGERRKKTDAQGQKEETAGKTDEMGREITSVRASKWK